MFRKLFHSFHDLFVFLYRRTHGRVGGHVQGLPVLLLRTIGRKTGQERTTPLGYFMDHDNYIVTASNAGRNSNPGWFYNLKPQPHVKVEVQNRELEVEALVPTPATRTALWNRLITLSPAYAKYATKTTREIPLVILRPLKNN